MCVVRVYIINVSIGVKKMSNYSQLKNIKLSKKKLCSCFVMLNLPDNGYQKYQYQNSLQDVVYVSPSLISCFTKKSRAIP